MAREGLIPTLVGTAVVAAGTGMRIPDIRRRGMRREEVFPMIASGVIGFGLAHVVLGAIDLIQDR